MSLILVAGAIPSVSVSLFEEVSFLCHPLAKNPLVFKELTTCFREVSLPSVFLLLHQKKIRLQPFKRISLYFFERLHGLPHHITARKTLIYGITESPLVGGLGGLIEIV